MSERDFSNPVERRVFLGGLLVIAALGAAARLWQVGESLWLDELHTGWVVSDAFADIGPRARMGNQNPLYFYIVRFCTFAFGENALALRLPSLVAGVALIVTAGLVTRRWCGLTSAGWLAAALVAVDHNMIFFAQEARAYALVQLVALLQLSAFWRLQSEHRARDRLFVVGGWILLFYLHYTAILVLSGELLWWAAIQVWQRGQGSYRLKHIAFDVGVTAIACLLSGNHLAGIAARRSLWEIFIDQPPPWAALRWFQWDLYLASTLVLCGGVLVAARLWRHPRHDEAGKTSAQDRIAIVPLLACWWSVPVLIAWFLTANDLARIFFFRYLIGVAVAPMLCAGLCMMICRGPRTRLIVLVAVTAWSVDGNGLWTQYQRDGRLIADRNQDWGGAIAWLNAERDDGSPVLVRSGLIEADALRGADDEMLREFCLLPVRGPYRIAGSGVVEPLPTSATGELSARHVRLIEQHGSAWLVMNILPAWRETLQRDLQASFPDSDLDVVREASFGNVVVWQVKVAISSKPSRQSSHLAPPR